MLHLRLLPLLLLKTSSPVRSTIRIANCRRYLWPPTQTNQCFLSGFYCVLLKSVGVITEYLCNFVELCILCCNLDVVSQSRMALINRITSVLTNIAAKSIFGFLCVPNPALVSICIGLRWKEDIFGMPVCMITEQDKKIHATTYTRTVFVSFAQSIAVFTMSVSALPRMYVRATRHLQLAAQHVEKHCLLFPSFVRRVSFSKHRGVCSPKWTVGTAQPPVRCIPYFMVGSLA